MNIRELRNIQLYDFCRYEPVIRRDLAGMSGTCFLFAKSRLHYAADILYNLNLQTAE
ncbi:hypothetical protein Clst_1676 [Thermoclostridium stercorarium subsp. stercorarium DSM 8532]|jgi:hypothetical protein|nr:hypothetical protein Clst_1676 [Thermoclostridium stercorarium subsp. stercorarium DSM 8532]